MIRLNGHGAPDLAAVLRDAGLHVDESAVPDWRDRSRSANSSWYADGRPTHIMTHHTASGAASHDTIADEIREARTLALTHPVRPVSNVYLGPSGVWYPLAAGPSNTNGVGQDVWGGGVPDDSMNSYAIAIEAGNNGVGEEWPQADVYVRGCAAMCRAYGIPSAHVRAHHEWAPTRKIDPASGLTPTPFRLNDRYGRFDMPAFRGAVAEQLRPPLPPDPLLEGDDVRLVKTAATVGPEARGLMLVGAGWRHWARDTEEGEVMDLVYGPALVVDARQYDVLAAMATAPSDGRP